MQSFARKMGLRSDWGLKQLLDGAMGAVVVLRVLLSAALVVFYVSFYVSNLS